MPRTLLDPGPRHAATTVAVTVQEEGPWVVLTVTDDGSGIPPAEREQVFERFARLQEGRARDEGGTGLGLSLTKRIVEHHGGRIHVEDGDSGGARFVISPPPAGWTGGAAAGDTRAPQAVEGGVGADGPGAAGEGADGQGPEGPAAAPAVAAGSGSGPGEAGRVGPVS